MKKFLKIGQLALVVMLLIGLNSCELEKKIRKHFSGKEQPEAQTANAPVAQEPSYKTPEPKVDGVFQVEARIYRIIDNYDGSVTLKATDHIVPLKIEHYDNGHMYAKGSMEVRFSKISGYEYEVESCMKAIQEGKLECPEMPHAETIRIMKILDDIRKSWNYEIPWIE